MAGEYIINFSSDALKDAFTILPRTVDNSTTLTLFGKGAPSYGEGLQENLVHLLENFCSDTAPLRATTGQLWYQNSTQALSVCTGTNPTTWQSIGIQSGGTAPTGVSVGTLWFNTSDASLNYWDGTEWVPIGGASITASDTAPTAPVAGQLWVDTTVGVLKYWSGTAWISIGTNSAETAYVQAIMTQITPTIATCLNSISSNVQDQINSLTDLVNTAVTLTLDGKVNKAGDTMTGYLVLNQDPLTNLQAATKRYVDLAIFNALQGVGGTVSSNQQHQIEISATTNGQTVFTLPATPTAAHVVYVSGVEQSLTNYTLVGSTLTLSVGVASGTEILVDYYDLSNTPGISALHIQTQVATAGQTVFTLTIPYTVGDPTITVLKYSLLVFVDGTKQQVDYSYAETDTSTITFASPLPLGAEVTTVSYNFNGTASMQVNSFTATASQTNFPISPLYHHTSSPTDTLNVGAMVYVAGVAQGVNEYIETNGSSIILGSGVSAGTLVEVCIFNIN